jgi:hypothetical protein
MFAAMFGQPALAWFDAVESSEAQMSSDDDIRDEFFRAWLDGWDSDSGIAVRVASAEPSPRPFAFSSARLAAAIFGR